jgi:hypothetical protein
LLRTKVEEKLIFVVLCPQRLSGLAVASQRACFSPPGFVAKLSVVDRVGLLQPARRSSSGSVQHLVKILSFLHLFLLEV